MKKIVFLFLLLLLVSSFASSCQLPVAIHSFRSHFFCSSFLLGQEKKWNCWPFSVCEHINRFRMLSTNSMGRKILYLERVKWMDVQCSAWYMPFCLFISLLAACIECYYVRCRRGTETRECCETTVLRRKDRNIESHFENGNCLNHLLSIDFPLYDTIFSGHWSWFKLNKL